MAIQKITIEEFLHLVPQSLLVDVRSPGEYAHAHIPQAISIPLFTDEERKIVGIAYKQQSRQIAIKIGLDFFAPKMRTIVEEIELLVNEKKDLQNEKDITNTEPNNKKNILLHCWRGGMRSAAIAWLLDLYGFKVFTLIGGYKAYRNWAIAQFNKPYYFTVIGGYTGSAKTLVLHQLKKNQQQIIDLENLANHKGSAFGALGQKPQPSQEMFENLLAKKLFEIHINQTEKKENFFNIFIEDESQRIGNVHIPISIWNQMRKANIYFLDISFNDRLTFITNEYGMFAKQSLIDAIDRIKKRLGGLETKNAISFLQQNEHKKCFEILLKYYDKWYTKGLYNRENAVQLIRKIECTNNVNLNVQNILLTQKIRNN